MFRRNTGCYFSLLSTPRDRRSRGKRTPAFLLNAGKLPVGGEARAHKARADEGAKGRGHTSGAVPARGLRPVGHAVYRQTLFHPSFYPAFL